MLEFRLLGQFDVRVNDASLTLPSRLAQSLLAYLLVNRTTAHRREKLAGLFWPDKSETNARGSLRQELWRIRKALDTFSPAHSDVLLGDDLCVGIDPHAQYSLDVARLENSSAARKTDDLMCGLDVYQGDLLPDFYDEWIPVERVRLHALFEQQVERLLEQLCVEQRWKETLAWAERWLALGQSPEPAYRALMVAHAALGNRSQVVAVFERCVTALKAGLGVEPSEQTRALFERLVKGQRSPSEDEGGGHAEDETGRMRDEKTSSFILHPAKRAVSDAPPYKGLHYFDEGDADIFFGRERLVTMLVSHLAEHHWLTVVGASGSGKSSLVRAGLVPALKEQSREWIIHVLTPTAHPLEALAVRLTRGAESAAATATLMGDLARDSRALRIYSSKSVGEAARLLLVIDQFEELFTLCREERERQSFIDNLLRATAPELDQPVYVVVALRADFYAYADQYANLREALSQRQAYIGPMTAEEMRRAVEGPAERGQWELEPGLVELILRDVGNEPGALPLLSHALLETWQRRRGRVLTLEGYASCGGVRGAIAQTAETVYSHLAPEGQEIARHIFLQLTELGEGTPDTRRRVTLEELLRPATDASQVRQVLNTLAQARLVTLGEGTAEVAHEALIREWSRLREWLNQNREALRLHRRLAEAAQAWERSARDGGELYRGARLAQALEWARPRVGELNPLEQEFLDASRAWQEREEAEREAQRQRELAAAQRLAEVEREHAERAEEERRIAFARELSVNAVNNLPIDPERSILLALQAVSVSAANGKPVLREAEEALHRAVQASRALMTLRGHAAGLNDIAYSPDGKRWASGSNDHTAKMWDVATGNELFTLSGHNDSVRSVAFSPDGKRLATSSSDTTAKLWDAATGEELLTLRGHTSYVRRVAFSPDGSRVATASFDGIGQVWDVETGQALLTLRGHTGGLACVAYSPGGTRLATGSWSDEQEHTARVWDANTGHVLLILSGHTDTVYDVAFSPDGKRIATCSGDGTAKIWDSDSGQLLLTVFVHSITLGVAFSPDPQGTRLATGATNGTAQVWDATTGELLETCAGHTSGLLRVSFNPDGTRLATASDDATAKVWDITPVGSREVLTLAAHRGFVFGLAYSPDGTRLATAGADQTAKIWDVQTGKVLLTLAGHSGVVRAVAFSPDGQRLATTGIDQTLKVWDTTTGRLLLSLSTSIFVSIAGPQVSFSPDGKWIASADGDGTAKVWDATTGAELLNLRGPTLAWVRGVAFSPDGKRLVTAGGDSLARIWDISDLLNAGTATGKESLTLSGHRGIIWAATYSPDGRRIATASIDGTARVWEAATGSELFALRGHTGIVNGVAFSPGGTRVATTCGDGTAKVWDVSKSSAQSEQPLTLHIPKAATGSAVAFSPDGARLAVSSYDGTVRIYALPLDDVIAIAKSRVTRSLTKDECQKFLHMDTCPPSD